MFETWASEILNKINHSITEIDLELHEWQEGLDMMSFIGLEVPLVYYSDGNRIEVGTARLQHDDGALNFHASLSEEHKNHPVLVAPQGTYSLEYDPGPPAQVIMKPVPVVAAFPKDPENQSSRGLPQAIDSIKARNKAVNLHEAARNMTPEEFRAFRIERRLENHPFFSKE